MKFSVALVAVVGLAMIASCQAEDDKFCAERDSGLYQEPSSGVGFFGLWNCMKYHECKDKAHVTHSCFFLIPLRLFDGKTKSCTWFWNATCKQT